MIMMSLLDIYKQDKLQNKSMMIAHMFKYIIEII